MGEDPINSLAEGNAFVNSALFALEQAVGNEQSRGWYFNFENITVHPNASDSMYYVSADVIDLVENDSNPIWLALRGLRLYNSDTGEYHTGTRPIKLRVQRLLAFEELPIKARRLVKAATVLLFQQSYDGDEAKIRDATREYQMAYMILNQQHIRSVKANFLPNRGQHPRRGGRVPR